MFLIIWQEKNLATENAKEVGGSLVTGWFVTVTNFAPYACGGKLFKENSWGKTFLTIPDFSLLVSKVSKLLVPQDIGQHNALEFFAINRNTVSEISREILNYIFADFDGSRPIKNITNRLHLGGLQIDEMSAVFTAESTKKCIPIRYIRF